MSLTSYQTAPPRINATLYTLRGGNVKRKLEKCGGTQRMDPLISLILSVSCVSISNDTHETKQKSSIECGVPADFFMRFSRRVRPRRSRPDPQTCPDGGGRRFQQGRDSAGAESG